MNSEFRNLITAVAASVIILIVWQIYFAPEPPATQNAGQSQSQTQNEFPQRQQSGGDGNVAGAGGNTAPADTSSATATTAPRIAIQSGTLAGSISRAGGRLDDLALLDYYAHDDRRNDERVSLLRKTGTQDSYFAEILFLAPDGKRLVPKDAVWQVQGGGGGAARTLAPGNPVTLTYTDGGVRYAMEYAMDDAYLITITARAQNDSGAAVAVRPFARLRRNLPSEAELFISYEGPLGVFAEGRKTEVDYDDIEDIGAGGETYTSEGGITAWAGITDKYWLVAMIPADQTGGEIYGFRRAQGGGNAGGDNNGGVATQVDIDTAPTTLAPGDGAARVFHLFAGPKKVNVLLGYNESLGVQRLDHAIDWGWFPFLTRPFFHALNWFYGVLGNFGLAIMALTVLVKIAFFPLANKSYHSMAKMRALAPKIQELRERFGDDRQRQQKEMMALYSAEKVNPAAGCLPILLQIPVFFALYKVLFVTIEMRHAPFYGWITDLSALDPTSIINLFGLLPFSTDFLPDIVNLGVWPILMGITMFVQMSLNPPPPDPVQARIFKLMPVFFTFLLATFPAGLVIYWTWNNLLSIFQQMFIMRSVKKAESKA